MNINREILNIKGEIIPMSFPTDRDIEKVKKAKKLSDTKNVLLKDLPKETVGNVLLNCVANYPTDSKKEVFVLSLIGQWIINPDVKKKELKKETIEFIVDDILPYSTQKQEKTKDGETKIIGLYPPIIISQVYDELGVKE